MFCGLAFFIKKNLLGGSQTCEISESNIEEASLQNSHHSKSNFSASSQNVGAWYNVKKLQRIFPTKFKFFVLFDVIQRSHKERMCFAQ
jgi:hypothetical protein